MEITQFKFGPRGLKQIDTIIFCLGETGADCVAGTLTTYGPLQVGEKHHIKGRYWIVTNVGENLRGEPVADLRPAEGE